jgi:hypothetical protein
MSYIGAFIGLMIGVVGLVMHDAYQIAVGTFLIAVAIADVVIWKR